MYWPGLGILVESKVLFTGYDSSQICLSFRRKLVVLMGLQSNSRLVGEIFKIVVMALAGLSVSCCSTLEGRENQSQ